MTSLTPTGAKILDSNDDGMVTGHPAAMARLIDDGLVNEYQEDGAHGMTEGGWAALEKWREKHENDQQQPAPSAPARRLRPRPHEAALTAAGHPDHLVPKSFNARTRRVLLTEGLAAMRPSFVGSTEYTYDQLVDPDLHLTADGRAYAAQHGIHTPRRRVVIISG